MFKPAMIYFLIATLLISPVWAQSIKHQTPPSWITSPSSVQQRISHNNPQADQSYELRQHLYGLREQDLDTYQEEILAQLIAIHHKKYFASNNDLDLFQIEKSMLNLVFQSPLGQLLGANNRFQIFLENMKQAESGLNPPQIVGAFNLFLMKEWLLVYSKRQMSAGDYVQNNEMTPQNIQHMRTISEKLLEFLLFMRNLQSNEVIAETQRALSGDVKTQAARDFYLSLNLNYETIAELQELVTFLIKFKPNISASQKAVQLKNFEKEFTSSFDLKASYAIAKQQFQTSSNPFMQVITSHILAVMAFGPLVGGPFLLHSPLGLLLAFPGAYLGFKMSEGLFLLKEYIKYRKIRNAEKKLHRNRVADAYSVRFTNDLAKIQQISERLVPQVRIQPPLQSCKRYFLKLQ